MEPRNVRKPKFHCRVHTVCHCILPLPDESRKHVNIHMNVILSSYDQVSHRYVPPSTFRTNFRSPYTLHHPCINQQTDVKFPWDEIRSEAYNVLLLLLLLLLFHGDSARFQAMAFPAAGVPRHFLRSKEDSWFTITVPSTCITICLLQKLVNCPLKQTKKTIKSVYFSIIPDFRKTMTSVERSTGFAVLSFYWECIGRWKWIKHISTEAIFCPTLLHIRSLFYSSQVSPACPSERGVVLRRRRTTRGIVECYGQGKIVPTSQRTNCLHYKIGQLNGIGSENYTTHIHCENTTSRWYI
jgi:hypothetical protein